MRKIALYAMAASLLSLGACNVFKSNSTRISGAQGAATPHVKTQSTATAVSTESKPEKTVTKTERTKRPAKSADKARPTSVAATVNAADLQGEWTIVEVNGRSVGEPEEMPYIAFDNGRFYGSNGCNILNASYSLSGNKLTLSRVASTMRFCPDATFEHEINVALGDGTPRMIAIDKTKEGNTLTLYGDNAHKLIVAKQSKMSFINGQWQVTDIRGHAVDDEECNVFFDVAEGKVHGNTGCNFFNGTLYVAPSGGGEIDLSNMGVTRMACPKTEQETSMLVALEETAKVVQTGHNTAALLDKKCNHLISLKKIPVINQE